MLCDKQVIKCLCEACAGCSLTRGSLLTSSLQTHSPSEGSGQHTAKNSALCQWREWRDRLAGRSWQVPLPGWQCWAQASPSSETHRCSLGPASRVGGARKRPGWLSVWPNLPSGPEDSGKDVGTGRLGPALSRFPLIGVLLLRLRKGRDSLPASSDSSNTLPTVLAWWGLPGVALTATAIPGSPWMRREFLPGEGSWSDVSC